MNFTRDRVRSIGWAFVLTVCAAMVLALTFRVNAVKSEVRLAERRIVSLKLEKQFLETEFQTRANQHQLTALNAIEFGYEAPRAAQYIEGERQLAALGQPRAPGAPEPIRFARAEQPRENESGFPSMVSPLTGQALAAEPAHEEAEAEKPREAVSAEGLAARLARLEAAAGNSSDE